MIWACGVVLGVAGYAGVYHAGRASHCCLEKGQAPELAWLQREFHLSQAEFKRISALHEQYLAGCAQRCARIDEKNREVARLLARTNTVTPEIERLLAEAALMRADCQKKMLEHFYAVSRTMPPEQGQRYLAWVQQRTVLTDTHASMHH
jgi:hypothetical protein